MNKECIDCFGIKCSFLVAYDKFVSNREHLNLLMLMCVVLHFLPGLLQSPGSKPPILSPKKSPSKALAARGTITAVGRRLGVTWCMNDPGCPRYPGEENLT